MTSELMEFAAAGLGLLSAFLEMGTAVLMAWLAARRFGEGGRSIAQGEPVTREETSPIERFARWTPRRRPSRRYEKYPS